MCVCVCVCLFSNLAWRWSWGGGGSWVGGWPSIPHPLGMGCVKEVQGASGASEVHFGKNFIKQKLQGAPDLVGRVTFLGPKSRSGRTWAPCTSGAMVTHYEGEFIKSKLYDMSLIVTWSGLRPPKLTLWSRGSKRGPQWGSGASALHFGARLSNKSCRVTPT